MNPNHRRSVLGIAVILASSCTGLVQSQPLPQDTRVRFTSIATETVGSVVRATPDSLVVTLESGQQKATGWQAVSNLEYSVGKRGHAGRGALIGAGVMTALTAATIVFDSSEDQYGEDFGDTLVILALPVNAAVGAGIGALVGLAWRTERWVPLPTQLATTVGPSFAIGYRF